MVAGFSALTLLFLSIGYQGRKKLTMMVIPSIFIPEDWSFTFYEGLNRHPDSILKDKTVAELGCGNGWITIAIAEKWLPSKVCWFVVLCHVGAFVYFLTSAFRSSIMISLLIVFYLLVLQGHLLFISNSVGTRLWCFSVLLFRKITYQWTSELSTLSFVQKSLLENAENGTL